MCSDKPQHPALASKISALMRQFLAQFPTIKSEAFLFSDIIECMGDGRLNRLYLALQKAEREVALREQKSGHRLFENVVAFVYLYRVAQIAQNAAETTHQMHKMPLKEAFEHCIRELHQLFNDAVTILEADGAAREAQSQMQPEAEPEG